MKIWINLSRIPLLTRGVLFFAFAASCGAQTATVPAPTTYQVARRDANSEVLQQTSYTSTPGGKIIPQVRSITKIATGLNYWTGSAWSPSDPTFQVSSDGQYAFANNVQVPVRLLANLAASNSVCITTPDGIVLNTTPVAIGFYDPASGNSLIIASVTNCAGTLIGSNQVLYESAFVGEGISADVLYTLQRGSFSQDVIWKQNIDPADYDFPTNSTRIQIFSAFNAPTPKEIARPIYVETNQTIRAQMASPDFLDHTLKFGQLEFGPGRALSTTATDRFGGAPIAKDFQTINGESYLVESIEFKDIKKELESLPQPAVSATVTMRNHSRNRKGGAILSRMGAAKGLKNLLIPVPNSATRATFAIKSHQNMVADTLKSKGVVADYIALPATEPDPMVFRSDTTYFVDGEADFDDVVLEGGSCLKYPNDTIAYVEVDGKLTCDTQPYLPCVLTAADDDSVGQSMSGIWTNYTGTVRSGGYANPALQITGNPTALSDLRISDAVAGISSEDAVTVTNLQVINCGTAFYSFGEYGSSFENVLVANVNCAFGGYYGSEGQAVNTTVVNCNLLAGDDDDWGLDFNFYNCVLANVTNLVSDPTVDNASGNDNGFYNCDNTGPGGSGFYGTITNVWPFQNAGAGNYYLTKICVFRSAGTTNNIDPALLTDLAQRTTWPPIIYDATNISLLRTLAPQAQRDTNSSPDLGFHESCLDYLIGGCDLSNSLAVASGTAIGWFVDHDPAHGIPESIALNDGANLSFNGTATRPSYFAESALLQENGGFNWYKDTNSASGGLAFNGSGNTNLEPELSANFSKFTSDGNANPFGDSEAGGYGIGSFKNCELYNGQVSTSNMLCLNFTNCLFFREAFSFWGSTYAMSFAFGNCTFYNGQLAMARSSGQNASFWSIENSAFDGTLLAYLDSDNGASGATAFDHNAYNTNNLSWQTYGFPYSNWTLTNILENPDPSDVLTSNYGWESIPFGFGNFYLPTNSVLLHMGSTNANLLGLFHFTTQTNQTVEGTNIVTIGYHYVATSTNGLLLDSNGDGIQDYLEDANGDGLVDNGETNWALAILTQPVSQIAVPGTNANFYFGADGVEPLSYQWYFNGTNIARATNSTLTLTNVQSINEGLYFAVVSNFSGSLTSSVAALEPSGLIGWWPGEGNALDSAGPNNGELTNGVSFTNGVIGQAFKFDGTNGYILVPDSPLLKPTNLTIEAWVRFKSLTSKTWGNGDYAPVPDLEVIAEKPDIIPAGSGDGFYNDGYVLFKQRESGGHDRFLFGVTASDGETEAYATNSAVSIQTNVWYFVAAMRGSNYVQIYVNGQASTKGSVDFDQSYGTAPLYFASLGEPDVSDNRLEGNLDEVALYSRALSSNEIQATYNAELSGIRNCFVPPVIVTQPSDQRVTVGTTATLLIAAAGSPPLSYQWSFNGTNMAGATNATLLLRNVQGTNTGYYSVAVSNNQGTVTSSNAFLVSDTCFPSVDVALVIDDSGSMGEPLFDGSIKLSAARTAATNFVEGLNFTNDQATLFSFNYFVTEDQTLTNSLPDLLDAIGSVTSTNGDTFMGNALQIAQEELAGPRHNSDAMPVMVFLSDGQPTDIDTGNDVVDTSNLVLGAATLVKASGTRLITVALGTDADTNFMALMATSPSDTYYATNFAQLTNVYNIIAGSICRGTNTPPQGSNTLSVQIDYPTNQTLIAGSNVTVSATVTNWPATVSLGWVQFFDGTNVIGFEANTNANTNTLYQTYWMPMNAGTDVLTAFAIGTNAAGSWSGWSAPVTNYVLGVPAINISSPANGTNLGSMYQSTLITAAVTPAAGAAIMNVSYYTNGVLIGTNLSSPPYPITSPSLAAGVYTLYATATDTNGATGISPNITVVVEASNQPPFVYAGPSQVTNLPSTELNGLVSDDGLPSNYLAVTWSLVSGPSGGAVMFGNSNLPSTTVTFNTNGTYEFQLSATDGQYTNTGSMTVLVTNAAPIVNAGPDETVLLPGVTGTNLFAFQEIEPVLVTNSWYPPDVYLNGGMDYFAPSNAIIFNVEYNSEAPYYDLIGLSLLGSDWSFTPLGNFTYQDPLSPDNEIQGPVVAAKVAFKGFKAGEIFSGNSNPGQVTRIEPDGTLYGGSPTWGVLTNATTDETSAHYNGYINAICLDQTGVWGGDVIVQTLGGDVWRINSEGQATEVYSDVYGVPPDGSTISLAYYPAGISVIPNDVQNYGPWAGRILSTGTGESVVRGNYAYDRYTIDTNGFSVSYNLASTSTADLTPGGIAIIPENESLFVYDDVANGGIWSMPASQFNGMAGDVLIMRSGGEEAADSGALAKFRWDGSAFHMLYNSRMAGGQTIRLMTFCPASLSGVPTVNSRRFQLHGAVNDAGLTSNLWHEVSGPSGATVTFDDPTLTNTFAEFSAPGIYTLRLTASDQYFTSYDDTQIRVVRSQLNVDAGTNQIIPTTNALLAAVITDAIATSNQINVAWSQISGPSGGAVTLGWTNLTTNTLNSFSVGMTNTASFTIPGQYVLQLTADDGLTISSTDVTIAVQSPYLTLTPGYGWPGLTNTPFTVTANLVDSNNLPIANTNIQFFVEGASGVYGNGYGPTWSTNTDANGNASFTYSGTNQGRDEIFATVTVNGQSVTNSVFKDWAMGLDCGSVITNGDEFDPKSSAYSRFYQNFAWTPESVSVSVPSESNAVAYADYYVFNGTSNTTVTLKSLDFMSDVLALIIRDPSNNIVATAGGTMDYLTEIPVSGPPGEHPNPSELTYTLSSSGDYLIEVVNLGNAQNIGNVIVEYALGIACNGNTNSISMSSAWPQLEVILNGTNITSGGTITFPPTDQATNITLLLTNAGPGDLQIAQIQTNGDFSLTNDVSNIAASNIKIPPGGSTNLGVEFNASAMGPAVGQLVLYGNIPVSGCFQAYLSASVFTTGAPPAITITSPRNLAYYYAPAFIPITATLSPGVTNIVSVTFEATTTNGIVPIETVQTGTNNSCGVTWNYVPNGNYSIFAVATDAAGRTTTSPAISVTVYSITDAAPPPLTTNVSFNVQINSANNVENPLASDHDPDGNSLYISAISSPPVNGSATIIDNGQAISYTPKAGFYSQSVGGILQPFDELSCQISNGKGGLAFQNVSFYVYPEVPPIVTITNPPENYSAADGASVPITAVITNIPSTNIAKVDFYVDSKFVGEVTSGTNGSYTFPWTASFIGSGREAVTAIATDILGEHGQSSPVYIYVTTPSADLIGALNKVTGSHGDTPLAPGYNGSLPVVRDGVFQLYGQATNTDDINVTWTLGVYSSDGSTLLRDLTPSSTGPVGTAGNYGLMLANCDLSTLQNGVYDLRLVVIGGGQEQEVDQNFILESNLKIGAFSFSQQDLVIPVNGIPLTVTRTYNSLNPDEGAFGYGWTYTLSDMDVSLDETRQPTQDAHGNTFSARSGGGRDITLTLPNGQRTTFYYDPVYAPSVLEYLPQWETAPGMPGSLKLTPGPNSAQDESIVFALESSYGGEPYWEDYANVSDVPDEVYDFPDFNLTTPDGTTYVLERPTLGKHPMPGGASGDGYVDQAWGTPYLAQIKERNGTVIKINSNSITSSSPGGATNQITFRRNSLGLISSISDPNAISSGGPPAVKYEYDANGNLIYVERLVNRSGTGTYVTNYFFYANSAAPHYITSILDGDGIQVAQNYYDDSGKLIKTVDASGNTTYFNNNLTNSSEAVVDRLGNTNSYVYDTRGNVISQTDPLGETTTNAYDDNNNLTQTIDPLGHTNTYAYDGNNNRTMAVDALGHTNLFAYDYDGDLTNEIDPVGDTTVNTYDGIGGLTDTKQFDPIGNLVTESSSSYLNGQLVSTVNANGQTMATFGYDSSSGYITNVTDAGGLAHAFGYDADGNQTNTSYLWTPPGGGMPSLVTNETFYDGQNRVIMTIDQYGDTNQTFYDLNGKVSYTVDKFGNTNSFIYDARGNQIQATDEKGNVTYTVYDLDSRPILTTDPNGITGTLTQYDADGRVTNTIRLENVHVSVDPDTNAPGQLTTVIASMGIGLSTNSTTYYPNGWVHTRTSPDGTTAYTYYADGQTETVTDPLTNTTSYAYDNAGRRSQMQDALSHTTQFQYDAMGRQIETIFDNSTSVSNVFNNVGQKVGTVDQAGLLTQYAYDVAGQLTNVIKPQVAGGCVPTWFYQYDTNGNLTVTTDPNGHCTTNYYNAQGNQLGQGLPMGQTNGWALYNPQGMLWKQFDFMGQMVEHRYDNFGQETNKYYFAAGASSPSYAVSYAYNQLDELTNVTQLYGTNASNRYEPLAYNSSGAPPVQMTARLIASVNRYPQFYGSATALFMLCMSMAAIPAKKRRWLISAVGDEVTRLKSFMQSPCRNKGRLRMPSLFWRFVSPLALLAVILSEPGYYQLCTAQAQCDIPNNFSTPTVRITSFTYDAEGNRTQVNSPEGVINYGYDLATGRLIHLCTSNSEIAYDYDADGRLQTVEVIKRNGLVLSPTETTTYSYDAVGNRSSVSLPNGIVTTYRYDDLNRLTNMAHQFGTTNLATYSYMLDATGRRTNAVEALRQEDSTYQTNMLTWQYDAMYRLTNEICISMSGSTPYAYTNAFAYDSVGNRMTTIRSGSGADTNRYAYNANDELLRDVSAANGTNTYLYDENGSLTNNASASGATSYTYDLANKLNGVWAGGSQQAAYYYNDNGIRVESLEDGATNHFLIDANNQTGYAQVLEELPALGATPTMSYVIGDDVLGQSTGSSTPTVNYFLQDGHGNNRQLIGMNGLVADHYTYDAYGGVQSTISSSTAESAAQYSSGAPNITTKLYCGEQYDSVLQMYNLRARYYDPANGRFSQRDTFAGNIEDPKSLHKYLYSDCDPLNGIDPSGQMTMPELLVTIGIILNIAGFLFHAYRSNLERLSGNTQEANRDEAWAMVDLLFLAIPGSGVIGAGLQLAKEGTQMAMSLLQAGVEASAVWGYLTTLFSGMAAAGGGGGGSSAGSGGASSSSNGPGRWEPENNLGRSRHSIDYEKQISGHEGEAYNVDGVKFDGFDEGRGVLLEAKDHYSFLLKSDGTWKPWFDKQTFVEQAEDQAEVAGTYPIEWHCSEKEVADALRQLVGSKVNVIYTPPSF